MEDRKYPIPDEIALLHDKAQAAKIIRDLAVKTPFGYRKAMKAAVEAIRFLRMFSKEVGDLYPELNKKKLEYSPKDQLVIITDE